MTPKLLVNENFPAPSLLLLRRAEFDVASVSESARGSRDVEVLGWAVREDRWLVTFDRDYGELVFAGGLPTPPAVILLRVASYRPIDPAAWIQSLCADWAAIAGSFVVFDGRTIRTRPLFRQAGHESG